MIHARDPALLVESLEAITPAWIDAVLTRAGIAAPPVVAVAIAPVGHGTTSIVARLTLRYAGPGPAPDRLIAKLSPSGGSPHQQLFGYEREVEAYRFFGTDAPCRLPRCYLAEYGGDGRFVLILEDLTATCEAGDQVAGCSIAQARAVTRELSMLHAATWNLPALASATWPRRRADMAARTATLFATGAAVMQERFGPALGPDAQAILAAVQRLVAPWSARTPASSSLIHTDPRVDNILFGVVDGEAAAWLIDLQQMALGDPAYDLAYFLTGSLSPEDRAACEREMVAMHAGALAAAHADHDAAGAWEAYRAQSIAGLVATVSAAGALAQTPAVDAILLALASRNLAAVAALDGVAAIEVQLASAGSMS